MSKNSIDKIFKKASESLHEKASPEGWNAMRGSLQQAGLIKPTGVLIGLLGNKVFLGAISSIAVVSIVAGLVLFNTNANENPVAIADDQEIAKTFNREANELELQKDPINKSLSENYIENESQENESLSHTKNNEFISNELGQNNSNNENDGVSNDAQSVNESKENDFLTVNDKTLSLKNNVKNSAEAEEKVNTMASEFKGSLKNKSSNESNENLAKTKIKKLSNNEAGNIGINTPEIARLNSSNLKKEKTNLTEFTEEVNPENNKINKDLDSSIVHASASINSSKINEYDLQFESDKSKNGLPALIPNNKEFSKDLNLNALSLNALEKKSHNFSEAKNLLNNEGFQEVNDSIQAHLKKSLSSSISPKAYLKPYISIDHSFFSKNNDASIITLNQGSNNQFNYSAGILGGFKLYKNFYAESGILFSSHGNYTKSMIQSSIDNERFINYNYDFKSLTIPVKLRFNYAKPFLAWYTSAGINLSFNLANKTNTFEELDFVSLQQYSVAPSVTSINYSLIFNTGFEFRVRPQISVFIEPEFRYSLSPMVKVKDFNPQFNPKNHSFGFGTGIVYKFFKRHK